MSKWELAGRLSAGLAVAAVLYVGRTCAVLAAFLLVYALVEKAWGVVGVLGMLSLAASIACGIASGRYLERDDGTLRRIVLVAVGAAVLMFLGAILVVAQVR